MQCTWRATKKLATEAGRKALVIITDAQDEGSKLKLDETIEAAQRTDTVVHVLLIHDPGFSWRPDVAKKLSDETGGRTIELSSEKKLMEAFDQISEELRSQYTVGYCPANPVKDGKFRKIRVATTNKDYLSHEFRPDPGVLLHRVSRQSFTRARGTCLREIGEWASCRRERVQVRRPTA